MQLTSNQQTLLNTYVQEVLRFRKALNLTSISQKKQFEQRFIEPTLAMTPLFPPSGRMLDIGSGMGIPGIPLMIALPNIYGILVERRKKRAEFLRHLLRKLKLQGEVHDADVRHLPSLAIDLFTARAVSEPDSLLAMCTPHANPSAQAIIPVSRQEALIKRGMWQPINSMNVFAGDDQVIQRYSLQCVKKGDVSRET